MNKKRDTYDRITVGERIRQKRIQLGLSQDELAVRINRATKYCSDIERGMCGMSIETMLSIAKALDMSLDYMMFGEISEAEKEWQKKRPQPKGIMRYAFSNYLLLLPEIPIKGINVYSACTIPG